MFFVWLSLLRLVLTEETTAINPYVTYSLIVDEEDKKLTFNLYKMSMFADNFETEEFYFVRFNYGALMTGDATNIHAFMLNDKYDNIDNNTKLNLQHYITSIFGLTISNLTVEEPFPGMKFKQHQYKQNLEITVTFTEQGHVDRIFSDKSNTVCYVVLYKNGAIFSNMEYKLFNRDITKTNTLWFLNLDMAMEIFAAMATGMLMLFQIALYFKRKQLERREEEEE